MKTIHYISISIAFCFFTLIIACQAQEPTQVDSVMLEKMYNDPIAVKVREERQKIADLILYGKVDLKPIAPLLTEAGGSCALLMEDISHLRGARDYVQGLCNVITGRDRLIEKYPEYLNLEPSQRSHITVPEYKRLTEQEIDQLIEIRRSPDR